MKKNRTRTGCCDSAAAAGFARKCTLLRTASGARWSEGPGRETLPKLRIADPAVRVAVADDVECVECVETEPYRLRFCDVEVLESRHVRVEESWTAQGAVAFECQRCWEQARRRRKRHCHDRDLQIPPWCMQLQRDRCQTNCSSAAMDNLQLAVLVDARVGSIAVGVVSSRPVIVSGKPE